MLSPMMQHYLDTKKEYSDCILFYRLGDFYEMFFDDAKTVSRELDLFLTGKDCGLEERAPMCGVPFHAADSYINKLVEKGYKIAIAEQVEDPKLAKGLVKREVIKIVTPGTNMNTDSLDADKNNFIAALVFERGSYGLAYCDITTGQFKLTCSSNAALIRDELKVLSPAELLTNAALSISEFDLASYQKSESVSITELADKNFDDETVHAALYSQFSKAQVDALIWANVSSAVSSAGALMIYLHQTQKIALPHITSFEHYELDAFMNLDSFTLRNLELTETMRDKEKKGSLLYVLDDTKTAMGARTLRAMLEKPLINKEAINARLDAVAAFAEDIIFREEIREYLSPIRDLERLMARIAYGTVNPRELNSFAASIAMIKPVREQLKAAKDKLLISLYDEMDDLSDLCELVSAAICDEPPLTVHEGGIIREGYNEEVDKLRHAKNEGKSWLASLESSERERTGIKTLKIKYNHVFGYCFEVTNTFKSLVPEDFIRRQTLTNAERYTTPKLKELEETIMGAEDRLYNLEYEIYKEIRTKIADNVLRVKASAKAIGMVDALSSLGAVAARKRFVRPELNEDGELCIIGGRHPVVEDMIGEGFFISNDTMLDNKDNQIAIITGPNMAGKSTYMRQSALIVLMAQIGSFVPAESAKISICDRIFTRVGASDDLASGQSTFMVEMSEVANILSSATNRSLLILDEIGRGTSTYDGLAIAWSVIEFISGELHSKTLFATHYHELTELEGRLDGVKNYCITVKEDADDIVFLRKIVRGGADKSYGVQVAKLAGLPRPVLDRAHEILAQLNDADITSGKTEKIETLSLEYGTLTGAFGSDLEAELKAIDINKLTPIEALNLIYNWRGKLEK